MRKTFNYKKKMNTNRRLHIRQVQKIIVSSAVASALVFQPFVPVIENGRLTGFTQESAEAATLADVGILRDVAVNAELSNIEGSDPYNLNLSLTGTGLADVGLVNPETVAVFYAPELAGDLTVNTPAQVRINILPITPNSLPALGPALDGITGELNTVVGNLVSVVDGILSNPLTAPLLTVEGLDELETALDALNNLDTTVFNVLEYNSEVPATVNADGSITVDFSEGLGNHLDSAVNDIVAGLLEDVASAIGNLNISLIGGTIEIPLAPVQALLDPVVSLADEIGNGALELTNGLVAAQVIGNTTVSLNALVDKSTNASGNVEVSGTAVNTNVIDVELLSSLDSATSVVFPDSDTTGPVITAIDDISVVENRAIEDILIEVDEPSDIVVAGLPAGLAYDETSGLISGTPVVEDWGSAEEERTSTVTITATDEAGNVGTEEFTITVQRDSDGDGNPDVTDPEEDTTAPEAPVVETVTSEDTEVTGTAEPNSEITVTLPNGETVTGTTNEAGDFVVTLPEDLDLVGGEELTVVATDEAGNTSDPTAITVTDATAPVITEIADLEAIENQAIADITVEVDEPSDVVVNGLPGGLMYDAESESITGTPTVSDWGSTEETRDFDVTVTATDEAGNEATETFVLTVQRDTDGDGDPDVTDPDDDNDGATDEEEEEAGTDPKDETDVPDTAAPIITPVDDVSAIENMVIDDIMIEVDEPSDVVVNGLPDGLMYDAESESITGTPTVSDWGATEETRDFDVTVTATDEAGNEATETFVLTVQRDTDGDGDPDVTDPDDDNDGATDEEEGEAGTDPKDETDVPGGETSPDTDAPIITPIEDTTIVENKPIEDILVEVNEPSDVVVEGLPDGLDYDPETGLISGTPIVNDWTTNETEREFIVKITAEDEAGNTSTTEFVLVIQRDTDRDGNPNVTDSDDDNDGVMDEEEVKAGTSPLDRTDYPGSSSGSAATGTNDNDQTKLPQTGESQSIFTLISGLVLASISAVLLMLNKQKKTSINKKK